MGPKIEKNQSRLKFSISIDFFNLDWNFQSRTFRIPTKIGVGRVARLKISISIENFNLRRAVSWIFSIFGPLGGLAGDLWGLGALARGSVFFPSQRRPCLDVTYCTAIWAVISEPKPREFAERGMSAGPKRGCLNVGAWKPQESGRKAPLSCNAAFSMLQCSFSFAAAQLLVQMTSALQKSQCCSGVSAAQLSENCSATTVFACGMLQGWGLEGSGLGLADRKEQGSMLIATSSRANEYRCSR